MSDFIPDSAKNLRDWADKYIQELPAVATRIGWPNAQVLNLTAQLTIIRDRAQSVLDTQNLLHSQIGLLNRAKLDNFPGIRQSTGNLKTTSGFTDGDAHALSVASTAATVDPHTYKPKIKVESHLGYNELTGKKLGVQALNFYSRIKGTAAWRLIAAKRSTFPFHDDAPPATPGNPEEREYMAMGVINDAEIGQPSDIVSAVFRSM